MFLKQFQSSFLNIFMTLRMSLPRNLLTLFQNEGVGIMASNSSLELTPPLVKFTHCPQMNKRSWISFLKSIWLLDEVALPNLLWLLPSFLSRRMMGGYAQSKTIENLT